MPKIVTFGCRLNAFESDAMAGHARAAGLDDAIVVNTCAVTAEAERQARQAIRRLKREHPTRPIVVAGCAAQLDAARYAAMPEVARVLGNAEKTDPAVWQVLGRELAGADQGPRVRVGEIAVARSAARHVLPGLVDHTRAFVEMQQGCDHSCTFCVIPQTRGPSRSVPLDHLTDHVRALVADGVREVVLTGVDLTAWGGDLPGRPTLGEAVRNLLSDVPQLPRLRLSSLDPAEIDETLWQTLAEEPRLLPHLHLSLQSGDDLILKRMKRRHTRAQALAACDRARIARPDVALGADLIAGFPTESDGAFANTLRIVAEARLDFVHAFTYSARPGTPAARMPQLPPPVVAARARALRGAGRAAQERFLAAQVGRTAQVLVERSGLAGRSEHFARVALDRPAEAGSIVAAPIVGVQDGLLMGRIGRERAAA
jgi:threonylcarbamoyladenosine tRNA methylthiotransferase MtaB